MLPGAFQHSRLSSLISKIPRNFCHSMAGRKTPASCLDKTGNREILNSTPSTSGGANELPREPNMQNLLPMHPSKRRNAAAPAPSERRRRERAAQHQRRVSRQWQAAAADVAMVASKVC